jgi:hypothetical protein
VLCTDLWQVQECWDAAALSSALLWTCLHYTRGLYSC